MRLKSFEYLCIALCFLGVRCQRGWGSNGGYNSANSNSWVSGFPSSNSGNGGSNFQSAFEKVYANSFSDKKPSAESDSGEGFWGINTLNSNGGPSKGLYTPESEKNSKWKYETLSNEAKQNTGNSGSWQSSTFNVRPSEGMPNSNTASSTSSKWSTNSNKFPFGANNNPEFSSSWESGSPFSENKPQNPKPGEWNFNAVNSDNFNNNVNKNEKEIIADPDYEDNSVRKWNSNNKKPPKTMPTSYAVSGKWETTTEKKNKNPGPPSRRKNSSNKEQTPSGHGNAITSSKPPDRNKTPMNSDTQVAGKPSILDELDKNDWYFGNASSFPGLPLQSTLNIDVSELWDFDRSRKKPNQNYRGGSNYSKSKRRNRQIGSFGDVAGGVECECVSVNSCDEEDMIITQEDIKYDLRPLEAFRCQDVTEVCCTKPKIWTKSRANLREQRATLQCGQRRIRDRNPFENLGASVAQPGEFPWMLILENAEGSCSASLIHHKLALTAAHCTTGALPNELVLKAGTWNSNGELSQTRRVTRIIPHPDYSSQNPRNDIALLVVEDPFELTENVNSVCLPVTNDKWDSSQCIVAGWRPEVIGGQVLKVLEKGAVNFLPQAECQNIMLVTDLWRNYVLHDSFVCGLERDGRQSCLGDEGGFLVCPSTRQPDTYLQVGIISKGINCDHFGRPGIFTNILKFLDWINKYNFELGLFDDIDIRSLP